MEQQPRPITRGEQLGLLGAPTERPRWSDLPRDTRRAAASLLARMLMEAWVRQTEVTAEEGDHE